MTAVLVVAGLAVLAVAVVDIVWTALAAGSGAGPLTGRLSRFLWRMAPRLNRHTNASVLAPAGIIILLSVLAAWIVLIFAGWLLVFSASEGAVRNATTGQDGDLYTVSTLGLGDYVPDGGIHISGDPDPVPALSLVPLVDAGIPVDPAAYDDAVHDSETRRRLLASFLHDDGWSVDDLTR